MSDTKTILKTRQKSQPSAPAPADYETQSPKKGGYKFRAEYEGQIFERTSETRYYQYAVIVWDGGDYEAVSWARDLKLAEKKAKEYKGSYDQVLVIPAEQVIREPRTRTRGGPKREPIPKSPAPLCRRCHKSLRGEESLARGYGDKCWRKHRDLVRSESQVHFIGTQTSISDRPQAAESRASIWDAIQVTQEEEEGRENCFCGEPINNGELCSYDHDGGVLVPGYSARQWFYIHCKKCGHDASIRSLGANVSALEYEELPGYLPDRAPVLEEAETQASEMTQAREDQDQTGQIATITTQGLMERILGRELDPQEVQEAREAEDNLGPDKRIQVSAKCENCGHAVNNKNPETYFETIDDGGRLFETTFETDVVLGYVNCPICRGLCVEAYSIRKEISNETPASGETIQAAIMGDESALEFLRLNNPSYYRKVQEKIKNRGQPESQAQAGFNPEVLARLESVLGHKVDLEIKVKPKDQDRETFEKYFSIKWAGPRSGTVFLKADKDKRSDFSTQEGLRRVISRYLKNLPVKAIPETLNANFAAYEIYKTREAL